MRYPDFLIVGAMKSGTTTLYFDLLSSDQIFLPQDKEPNLLSFDHVLSEDGRSEYASLFNRARGDQICGEASTGYTQYPRHRGAAVRAKQLLRPDAKIVYVVRDPIDRIVSHYRHEWSRKTETRPILEAVQRNPEYLEFSKYATQFSTWREAFPLSCSVFDFGRLQHDRGGVLDDIALTLGIDRFSAKVDTERIDNASQDRQRLGSGLRRLQQSTLYQEVVRPLTTPVIRRSARGVLLRRAPQVKPVITEAFLVYVLSQLSDDIDRHAEVLGVELWTCENLLRGHLEQLS